jgi:ABC-2 type transport system permease protein
MQAVSRTLAITPRMLAIMRVELLKLLFDRTSLGLILMVPVVQIVLFGYAVNLSPANVPVVIASSCRQWDAMVRDGLSEAAVFRIVSTRPSASQTMAYLSDGRARIAVECAQPNSIRLTADGTDPLEVRAALGVLQTSLLKRVLRVVVGFDAPTPEIKWLYSPESRTAWFLAPGLIGVVVMISMLMLGALTLVREREEGSWEGLLASPVTAVDALAGKLTPYVVIALAQTLAIIVLAQLLFAVPVRGELPALLLSSAVFAVAHLTLGFGISAVAHNQTQAIQGAVFFYLPSMLLSGFMFPFESMPAWAQFAGRCLPLTHFVRYSRAVLLKGFGTQELWTQMWPVVVFAAVSTLLSLFVFRRQLK